MSMLDAFKGMGSAQVHAGRLPPPALGKSAFLINSVRVLKNRVAGTRTEIIMTALWGITAGVTCEGNASGPNVPGDRVSHCLFSGEYFQKNFKEFCLAALGKSVSDEMDITDWVCPKKDPAYASMTDLQRLHYMWDTKLPGLICALDTDGNPVNDAGVFDGQVVIEVAKTEKLVHKKLDAKGADIKSNWVHDESGKPFVSKFPNVYFNRRIPFAEVRQKLDDEAITKFFGSMEDFTALLQATG